MTDIKLTKAQREHLEYVARSPNGQRMCSFLYRPHMALVKLGFASESTPPHAIGQTLTAITPAGREWLAANSRRKE
jgi:hypothetical protein